MNDEHSPVSAADYIELSRLVNEIAWRIDHGRAASRRSRSSGPRTTARSTTVPSDVRTGRNSTRAMTGTLTAAPEPQIKIAYGG